MHDGCSASFTSGKQVVDKVRMMGFSDGALPLPLPIKCECGTTFEMEYFEIHVQVAIWYMELLHVIHTIQIVCKQRE